MSVLNKKVSKFVSEQSGAFNVGTGVGQNRNIDIVVPSSLGVVSLKDTFIQLRASIILDPEYNDLIVPYFLVNRDSEDVPVRNVDIIRNCWMSCTNFGRLEDIRRVNVLRKNLQEHSEGVSSKLTQGQTLYNLTDPSTLRFASPFIEIHKDDGFSSKIVDAHLRIKMEDLFELGSVDALDLGQLGDLRIHIELEQKDYFQVKSVDGSYFPKQLNENTFDDISGVPNANQIEVTTTFSVLETIPYYKGQQLVLAVTFQPELDTDPTIETSQQVTVTNVSVSQIRDVSDNTMTGYIVTLTFNPPFPDVPANYQVGVYEDIEASLVVPDDDANTDIQYLTCELAVCHYLSPMSPKMGLLEWTTYTTEEYTNGFQDLNKIFELESNCTAVFVMFANNNGLISNFKDHFAYRMRVDNVDMYEYDIEVNKTAEADNLITLAHDALYWDALTKLFTQTGKSLKCLVPALATGAIANLGDYTDEADSQITILGTPTQLTPQTKLFQLTIQNKMGTPQTPVNNVVLFKNVQKSLKL